MSWAELGFWVAMGLTVLFGSIGVIGYGLGEGADRKAGVLALLYAVFSFLVVCLFGHLGNVPTWFG